MREPSDSLAAAAEILDRLGGDWALIGALAALYYRATPRVTSDVDILAERVEGLVAAFEAEGYQVQQIAADDEPAHMLLIRGRGDRIDVLLPVVEYQEVALARAQHHVITVEDVIVHKLIAWRPRDRDDVLSILSTSAPLDERYIEQWAQRWEVLDRWEQARRSR